MELLRIVNLSKRFRKNNIVAVDDVSFSIYQGEVLGLVGESGCGKSTLAKLILRLIYPDMGSVFYRDIDLFRLSGKKMQYMRRFMQIIFQDPYTSFNPRMRIGDILEEVHLIHGVRSRRDREQKVIQMLELVGLDKSYMKRFPAEVSGGERQRLGIARALSVEPEFIICDEPVSNLDLSVQAQILNLLMELQKKRGLTYLFISHDLDVIGAISDRVIVMQSGRFVEEGSCEEIFINPQHFYTKALLGLMRERLTLYLTK